ncbi:hypothetical protein ACIF80_32170 [Streptomyces sp. NPDC085927]|uniref:hypothetical protein n=1 Tax=Streptomyces sp. NPDC085927 TaxID=3365738 RepID=UPI0037D3ADBB
MKSSCLRATWCFNSPYGVIGSASQEQPGRCGAATGERYRGRGRGEPVGRLPAQRHQQPAPPYA